MVLKQRKQEWDKESLVFFSCTRWLIPSDCLSSVINQYTYQADGLLQVLQNLQLMLLELVKVVGVFLGPIPHSRMPCLTATEIEGMVGTPGFFFHSPLLAQALKPSSGSQPQVLASVTIFPSNLNITWILPHFLSSDQNKLLCVLYLFLSSTGMFYYFTNPV